MNISILDFIIIFILSIFQSVFGVGLLLFGTPIFLMLDYDFISTLMTILPVSIIISFFQIMHKKNLKKNQIQEFNMHSLPFLFIFLIISIHTDLVDIKLFVSILLIISALITLSEKKIIQWKKYILKYKKYFLMFIGSIHGYTNMGGSFLSIFSSIIHENDKFLARGYIAYGYLIMGIIQCAIVLFLSKKQLENINLYYVIIPLIVFFPSQKIFRSIKNTSFKKIIGYIALTYGIISIIILSE